MSIPGITAITRIAPTVADTPTANAPMRQSGATYEGEIDGVTQLPVPPRFPWLSRLSQQPERATGRKPAFAPVPVLGDNLDRQV